jgi:K+-sensing histidine kinase KdpD
VIAATRACGFVQGVLISVASVLAAAFFFYEPVYGFYVASPEEVVELIILRSCLS